MTRKVLTGTYSSGYTIHSPVTILTLAARGYVGGDGIESEYKARAYTVVNLGTIAASGNGFITGNGVFLYDGGNVTNGSSSGTSAIITAYCGIKILSGLGTVANFGTIAAKERSGIFLSAGGSITNGSASDRTASISTAYRGDVGIECGDFNYMTGKYAGVGGTITNFATISGGAAGIFLSAGGAITNGAPSDATALITGGDSGLELFSNLGGETKAETATVTNFGTIVGGGADAYSAGVIMRCVGQLTNGSANDATSSIVGNTGVFVYDAGDTVANFGTIEGTGGVAVDFKTAGDTLALHSGSIVVGGVDAGGGTIDALGGLATVRGDLTNVGAIIGAGTLTVAGAVSVFGPESTIRARVTLGGEAYIAGNLSVTAKGALTARSLVVGAGDTLTVSGAGSSVVATKVTISAGGIIDALTGTLVEVDGAMSNAGTVVTSGGTAILTGPLDGAGALQIHSGTLQVTGPYIGAVAFTGTTGVLQLGLNELTAFETITFLGTVSGLSTVGKSSLDLLGVPGEDIATVAYVDNGHRTGGTLTVTVDDDGQGQSDVLTLAGDYVGGTWASGSDGHGGTKVIYRAANAPASPHAFIGAMAALGSSAGQVVHSNGAFPARDFTLTAPRSAIA